MSKQNYYDFVRSWESDAEQVAGLTMADDYYYGDWAYADEQTEMDQDEHDPWEEIN